MYVGMVGIYALSDEDIDEYVFVKHLEHKKAFV